MKHSILGLMYICMFLLVSCASKTTISEKPEYLKNIHKNEIKELVSYPLCIVMSNGAYCGDRNLGNLFVLTEKISTGKDTSIEQIIDSMDTNDFGNIRIQKLSRSEILVIPEKERIGDSFYKMLLKDKGSKVTSLFFGVRTGKVYVPYTSIKQIIAQ